jgi:hypothetical protein
MRSLARCLVIVVLTIAATPLQSHRATADINPNELVMLGVLERTLALERDAAGAIRRQDTTVLRRLSAEIKRTYASALAEAAALDRARNTVRLGAVGPCQLAGLTLRRAVVGFADGRLKPRIRPDLIDAIPPDLTDQFAAHMQRCELTERTEATRRLIGTTCLIDGRRCRESER